MAGGEHDGEFPLDVFQTGSGTSSNMNANEVIATLAARELGRPVHPNDHVNASQSSNDVFPSAIHLAAAQLISRSLRPALDHLAAALEAKAAEFADVVKSGRTHLMDATPVTLGQEFGGYAAAIRHGGQRADAAVADVSELPLGGTAVGTGLNAPRDFAARVIAALAADLDLPLIEARDHFEAAGGRDALVAASGMTRTIAVGLYKICTDLRLMNSGPRTGLAEITVPDLQPGSSIMPGKVNPVICEAVMPGLRPGHRQRRGRGVRGSGGQLRAQRDAAGHRAQPARLADPAQRGRPAAGRQVRGRDHRARRAAAPQRRIVAVDRDRA